MKRKLRVAYITHAKEMGGAEYNLLDLLRDIDITKISPIVISPGNPYLHGSLKNRKGIDFRFHPMGSLNFFKSIGSLFSFLKGIRTLAHDLKTEADIVHVCSYRAALYGLIAGKLARKRTVWHVHDLHKNPLFRYILPLFADKMIAVSEAVRKQFPVHVQQKKVRVIYNGVDTNKFDADASPGSIKKELGLQDGTFLIGAVGRLTPWKRFHYIIQALPSLIQKYPNLHLAIVGDSVFSSSEHKEDLISLTKQLNLNEHVHFLGNREDIPNVMKSLDLFINYSEAEPFGRVIIEAMVMETPVIVANSGGAPEIIEGASCGIAAKDGDVNSLTNAIEQILSLSGQERAVYGMNGRQRVLHCFDSKHITEQVMEVYDELLGSQLIHFTSLLSKEKMSKSN